MIKLFPSPGCNTLTIESDDHITEVVLMNSSGSEFPVDYKEKTVKSITLDTSKLGKGIYLIGLSTQTTWIMKKFTITR